MKKSLLIVAACGLAFAACQTPEGASTTGASYKVKENQTVNTDSESEKFTYGIGMLIGSTLQQGGVDSVNYGKILEAIQDTPEERAAYAVASREVQGLLQQELDLADMNKDILVKGIYDVLEADTTLMNGLEAEQAYRNFLEGHNLEIADKNLAAGKAYLENNVNNEGVQVTESGLQHQLIQEGTGEKVTQNDVVKVEFAGKSIDGVEFESTDNLGGFVLVDMSDLEFYLLPTSSRIPQGILEAINLYPLGSEFRIFMPSSLGYGAQRIHPEVGPNSAVIYEIKTLDKLEAADAKNYRRGLSDYKKNLQEQARQAQQQR